MAEFANELRRLTDALGTTIGTDAERRASGERIESATARTEEVARASAKSLGIALATFVDAQKQLVALLLEKNVDERTSSGGRPSASVSSKS